MTFDADVNAAAALVNERYRTSQLAAAMVSNELCVGGGGDAIAFNLSRMQT